ncbi:MAG TPA: beta-Ala-His dipeptidase [Methanocorpusculum sp.]|nr:beta-Ala-His dipeptidase [Methanocorpusculum sp.]
MKTGKILLLLGLIVCACLICAGCVAEQTSDKQAADTQDRDTQTQDTQNTMSELDYFYEINKIPRPSGNTAPMQEYLISFAKKNNLEYLKDETGNILIKHPGTSKKSIILQGHQDMVPAVETGYTFDFTKDSIETYIEDGWIHAKHTTLGADDGAGVAIILTALTSPELKDYTISGLFTVDEETTMAGAENINPAWLNADALLNIDNEITGETIISSAGGTLATAKFTPECVPAPAGTKWYQLEISGLLSGHSGDDIDKGRLNAILLAADFLSGLDDVKLASISGGSVHNAIPGSAGAVFATSKDVDAYAKAWLESHYTASDPDLDITVAAVDAPEKMYAPAFTEKFLETLCTIPDGVLESDAYGVITSSNTGVITNDGTSLSIESYTRGTNDSKHQEIADEIADSMKKAGADAETEFLCPGWSVSGETEFMQTAKKAYLKLTGKQLALVSTHSGLECGYFAEKNPELMILSIGPTIENPHTINERMNLDSFTETKDFTFEIVKMFCAGE